MQKILQTTLLAIIAMVVSAAVSAQDKIYKTDGAIIEAKVKTVGVKSLIYLRFDKPDGPEYTILKKEVTKIVYQNGTTDVFDGRSNSNDLKVSARHIDGNDKAAKTFGNNILSITPAAYTTSVDGTMNDVGVGITYERLLDKRGHIGLNIPVMMCFTSNKDFNQYYYAYSGSAPSFAGNYHSFMFMPGIKVYPARSNESVRYSLGASLFCDFGTEPMAVYDYNYNQGGATPSSGDYHYTLFGLMISNSINITAARHVYLALDLGAGIPFSDNRRANKDYAFALIPGPFIQFGFKLGYRY